jgi:hypothetical protein
MDDRLRVSDAERDGAAALLRDHFAAGRLSAQGLEERLAMILAAQTFGDLRRALAGLPPTAPVLQPASLAPAEAGPLVRGYRRLLACYPVWYRRVHEEEMLAVLMTAAPPGKRRPSIAEAADLLWGALRIRCQPSRTGAEPAWRDALAVASVIVPLILVVVVVVNQAPVFLPGSGALAHRFRLFALEAMAAPLAMAVVVPLALRMRRVAALTGAGLPIVLVFSLFGHGVNVAIGEASLFLAIGLQTVAMTASAGPRRGLQILTRKHAVLVLVATLLVCTRLADIVSPAGATVRLIMLTAVGTGMALTSSLGRWLLLLLAIPAWPLLLMVVPAFPGWALNVLPSTAAVIVAWYLPPAALAALAARRASAHSPKPLGTPGA